MKLLNDLIVDFLNKNSDLKLPDIKLNLELKDENQSKGLDVILCADDYGDYEIVVYDNYLKTITVNE